MKVKIFEFLLLILLITVLTGCDNKNNYLENENTNTNTDIVDYENMILNGSVNIYTDSNDFGSGFIYNNSYIITNYHVLNNATVIKIVSSSKNEYNASLVGFNYENDIAILKIEDQLGSTELGDSDEVKVGDIVTAIGNPNGDLFFSKAKGKVLNMDQELLDKIDKHMV